MGPRTAATVKSFTPNKMKWKSSLDLKRNETKTGQRPSLTRWLEEDCGLETVEYAVITAMIVTAIVVALGSLTLAILGVFESVRELI